MADMCDVMENDIIDVYMRGQPSGKPSTWSLRLYTAAPGETGGGTEASYTNYAAVSIAASLADMAGTQSAGSTTASSGTGGQTSNNNALTWGTAAGSGPQTLTHFAWCNSTTPWIRGTLTASRTINNGDAAPTAAAGQFTITAA
ncbi:MAG: hypothetical protein K2Y26_17970 [Gemmatimonadaceae bacterium]|nr:hypothetical protein [Gemmatimonadaceae bacterium]